MSGMKIAHEEIAIRNYMIIGRCMKPTKQYVEAVKHKLSAPVNQVVY